MAKIKRKKAGILKLRTRIQPSKEHKDKTKYSRKGKWAKRKGLNRE